MDNPNETGWQIVSGVMGSVVPVALSEKISLRKALIYIFVGSAVSYYFAPFFSHTFSVTTAELKSFVGFVTGLLGVQLAHALLVFFRSAMIQGLLARWLSKLGYGESDDPTSHAKRN